MSQIVLYFSQSTLVLYFYINVVLKLFINPLRGEAIFNWWISVTRPSNYNAERRYFCWLPEQAVEKTRAGGFTPQRSCDITGIREKENQ